MPKVTPKKVTPSPWLSVNQVAHHVGVHPRTVRRWIEDGDLRAYKFAAGTLRIRLRDVERMAGGPIESGAA